MGMLKDIVLAGMPDILMASKRDALGELPADAGAETDDNVTQLASSIQYALDRGTGFLDTLTNQPVKAAIAVQIAASYRCMALISESIGLLPGYIEGPDGFKVTDYKTIADVKYQHLAGILLDGRRVGGLYHLPSLLKQLASDLTIHGNCYLTKFPEHAMIPNDLEYTPPWGASTEVIRADTGHSPLKLFYRLQQVNRPHTIFVAARDVVHGSLVNLTGVSNDRYLGTSPLQASATSIVISRAAEKFIKAYFDSGGFGNQAFVSIPGKVSESEAVDIENRLHRKIAKGGMLRRMITVLGMDAKVIPTTVDTQSAAMAQLQPMLVESIARVYGVPGALIGVKTTELGKGLEELTKIFVKFSLKHYKVAIESAISYTLFNNEYKFRLDTTAFSAGDLRSLSEFITAAVGDAQRPPIMTAEELRGMIDTPQLGPLPEWQPQVMTPNQPPKEPGE